MLSKGALPNVVRSWQLKDISSLQRDVSDMLYITLLIATPSGLGITFLAKPILNFLYSQRVDEIAVSYESLSCMGIGVIFLCLAFPLFSVLQGINRPDLPIKIMLVGVVVKFLGNVVLLSVPSMAVYGAGISTTVCYFVIFVMSFVVFSRVSKVKINLLKMLLPIAYGSILCAVSATICNDVVARYHSERLALLLAIFVGGGVYLVTLYLLGFKPMCNQTRQV
jgi:stage V sporulation protein B